ncbi:MAG: elongation factor P maturation arginine rhamnosyltransferase EarP [Rhodocyclaceae bacterium]|nr:elongation factor P maturation arginine rhamnosyltransferase EarP [Rhodocyclaceae bacterium]
MRYMSRQKTWDLFCRVVDNFGDIGVCWRLARQLAGEYDLQICLWVDDFACLQTYLPQYRFDADGSGMPGVEIRHWTEPFPDIEPAQTVVEAFACELPVRYVQAMAARAVKPCWINLEYLSAEAWAEECHGMASPSPSLPLTKHFFFPGFTSNSGGVPMERDLPQRRQAFQEDAWMQVAFWQTLGLAPPRADESRISLFCYPDSQLENLLALWRDQGLQVTCLVPEGSPARRSLPFSVNLSQLPALR